MTRRTKPELTAESIIAAIERDKPTTITTLARSLGYSGSVSSWLRNKLVELVPDLNRRIEANKTEEKSEAKVSKPKTAAKAKTSKKVPRTEYSRVESNPMRPGSAYATCFDILAHAGDKGIERAKLVAEVARITGKTEKNAYYDVTVVASSRKDGRSHRSIQKAADGYYVERTDGNWLRLILRDRKF